MNLNYKQSIFFDHYDTINRIFNDKDEEFSELTLEERLIFIEKMCKYMYISYTTEKMKLLYESFLCVSKNEKSKYAQQILEEYMEFVLHIREISGKTNKNYFSSCNLIITNEIKETYRWLCNKLPDFEKINFSCQNALIYGQVQSGKSEYIFGISIMHILSGGKVVIINRNSIKDAVHMKIKLLRFSFEHQEVMKKIGISNPTIFESVYAGDISFNKNELYDDNKHKVVIAINNGTQLNSVNKFLDNVGDDKLMIILDEADVTGYAVVKNEPRPILHAAMGIVDLKLRSSHIIEVTATIWDILKGNSTLTNNNIYKLRPSYNYKSVLSVRAVNLKQKFINDIKLPFNEQDPNFDEIFETLTITPYFNEEFGVSGGHPICVLHKTYVQIQHIDLVFDYMINNSKFNKKWVVIKEHSEDISMFVNCLKGFKIKIDDVNIEDNKDGIFSFPKKIIIPHILQWLRDNGGVDKFSHIFIKSGKFADRCRSYVSIDGAWHLTHEYSGDYKTLPGAIQGMRLLHNRPDSIPLTYFATKKTNKNIRKGYLHQEEQIERLKMEKDNVFTSKRINEEKWCKDKIPSLKLCCESTINSNFRIDKKNKLKGEDGYKPVLVYNNELNKIITFENLKKAVNEIFTGEDRMKFSEGQKPCDMKAELKETYDDSNKSITKQSKQSLFKTKTKISEVYSRDRILEILEECGYMQPSSILSSFSNPKETYGKYVLERLFNGNYKRIYNEKIDA